MSLVPFYADASGAIYDAPGYRALARLGDEIVPMDERQVIALPEGSDMVFLPERPVLVADKKGRQERLATTLYAVAALLPPGYTRTLLPAFERPENVAHLPLFGYTAVALQNGQPVVAAIRTDDNKKWNPTRYNTPELADKVASVKQALPNNRIVEHLSNCALNWHCATAQNLFYRRWEAGLPISPVCNAACLGCISRQPAECCPSPQDRIDFAPTPKEIEEVMLFHLEAAPDAIISFGQGCEGEPSLGFERAVPAMRRVREQTQRGMININSNAGNTQAIMALVDAGLDSMRVSIISAREAVYEAYYRPAYTLTAVEESIRYARAKGVFVSLNLLTFPGLNDREDEVAAWIDFLARTPVDMIQLRNLNMDPDWLVGELPSGGKPIGIANWIDALKKAHPAIQLASFTHYVK